MTRACSNVWHRDSPPNREHHTLRRIAALCYSRAIAPEPKGMTRLNNNICAIGIAVQGGNVNLFQTMAAAACSRARVLEPHSITQSSSNILVTGITIQGGGIAPSAGNAAASYRCAIIVSRTVSLVPAAMIA